MKILKVIYIGLSLFYLLFITKKDSLASGNEVINLDKIIISGKSNIYLNDIDLGNKKKDPRFSPLYQSNNYNIDLNGCLHSLDDRIEEESTLAADLDIYLKTSLTKNIDFKINLKGDFGETFLPGGENSKLYIQEINISPITKNNFSIKIGKIFPYFTFYTLSQSFVSYAEKFTPLLNNLTSKEKLDSLSGIEINCFFNPYINFTLVAGRVVNEKEYQSNFPYSTRIFVGEKPENIIFYLSPSPGFKNKYEERSNIFTLLDSSKSNQQDFFVKIFRISENNKKENITSKAILNEKEIFISKEILKPYDEIYCQWSPYDPKAVYAKYLNAVRFFRYFLNNKLTTGFSYVNLHDDRNSIKYSQDAKGPLHSGIWSIDTKYYDKNNLEVFTEFAISKYHPSTLNPIYKDFIFFVEARKYLLKDKFLLNVNYRNLFPDYILAIAPTYDLRNLILDKDKNGYFDFEDRYFKIGQEGIGLKVEYNLSSYFTLINEFDYQQNKESKFLEPLKSIYFYDFKKKYYDKYDNYSFVPLPGIDNIKTVKVCKEIKYKKDKLLKSLQFGIITNKSIKLNIYEQIFLILWKFSWQENINFSFQHKQTKDKTSSNYNDTMNEIRFKIGKRKNFSSKGDLFGYIENIFIKDYDFSEIYFQDLINIPYTSEDVLIEGKDINELNINTGFSYQIFKEFTASLELKQQYFKGLNANYLTHTDTYFILKGFHSLGTKNLKFNVSYSERCVSFDDEKMNNFYSFKAKSIFSWLEIIF